MNTVASQLSGFPDSSAGIEGKYLEGPTFYEWLKSEKASAFLHSDPVLLDEALQTGPDTYTSRALYGAYLHWVASGLAAEMCVWFSACHGFQRPA